MLDSYFPNKAGKEDKQHTGGKVKGSIFRMGAVEHREATKGFSLRKPRTFLKWKNSTGTSSRQVCISFLILRELSHSRFANDDIYK